MPACFADLAGHSWHEVIQKTKRSVKFDAIWEQYKAEHPEPFQPDSDPAADGA